MSFADKFRKFIVDKYTDEYDDFDADGSGACIQTVVEYLDDWYDGMSCNIDRRWIDVNELMSATINEDEYELYEYDEETDTFDEVEWDDDVVVTRWTYDKYHTKISKWVCNKNLFVAKYYKL